MTYGSCHSTWESKVHTWLNPYCSASLARWMVRLAGGLVWSTAPKSMISIRSATRSTGMVVGSDQVLREAALEVAAVALRAEVLVVLHDDLAPRHDRVDLAVDLEALPRRVIHVHVVGGGADAGVPVRVVDDDVGVGSRLDDALRAVEAEHARGRGARELDPALEGQLAGHDALVHEIHAVLDGADAVGDLAEVAEAELLLILHAERAVVGGDHLQVVGAQRLPHGVLVPF